MIDDFQPIIHHLDGRTIKVWAIADVHLGAKECDLKGFKAFLKRIQDDPDSYIVIVGDVLDNGLRNSLTNPYHATVSPQGQLDLAVELLTPVKDRILGAVGGNHEYRSVKECDNDLLFIAFAIMGIPERYRQNLCFVRVCLERGKIKDHYALMLTHGKSKTKNERFPTYFEGIDAAILGHTHTPDVKVTSSIRFGTNNKVTKHDTIVLTACSWLNPGGYSLRGCYAPTATAKPQCLELPFINSNDIKGRLRVIW